MAEERTGQLALWGFPPDFPWGKPAQVTVPAEFWSDEWLMGVRAVTYLGHICSHHDPAQGPVCVQPKRESQAEGMAPPCIPFDPDTATITVLPGKLADYV